MTGRDPKSTVQGVPSALSAGVSRRGFLGTVGAGALGLSLGVFGGAVRRAGAAVPAGSLAPNVFVTVFGDGRVEIICHRTEIGQGVRSSIPLLIGEELGADPERVTVVQAVGDKRYGDQNTDGSRSIRQDWDKLRVLGATAREMLVSAAAGQWRVPVGECVAADHRVTHTKSGRALGFGALVDAAAKLPVPKNAKPRPVGELKRIGVGAPSRPLHDGQDIATGAAIYGADVRLDGMLTAVVVRPPTVFGKVARVDDKAARAVPGVVGIVMLPELKPPAFFKPLGGVAVVARDTWAAMRGAKLLEVEWDLGPNASYDSVVYRERLFESVRKPGRVAREVGDVDMALASATKTVVAEYYVPHLAHAPMEPPVAVARFTDAGCEVWAPTQNPQAARAIVAQVLGVDEAVVTVNVTLAGAGFGRKSKPDFVAEAALISKAMKAPVRVQWTRADDLRNGYFHAVSAQRYEAGLDAAGKVVAWKMRTAFPPIPSTFNASSDEPSTGELGQGVTDVPLMVPNVRVEAGRASAHVRIGWLRSVCNIFHGFGLSSFVDELAVARGIDAKDMWLELVGPARMASARELGVAKIDNYGASLDAHPIDVGRLRHVIERVTAISGWANRPRPKGDGSGRAFGLGVHRSFLAAVACVAAVELRDGKPHVDEVWIVIDAGQVVNAERVRSQMEGAVFFGMSLGLHGAITMKGGVVEQSSYRDYPIVRMDECPRAIHVDIIASTEKPAGVGEPGVPPVAPAIANALAALTGKRLRELPLRTV